MADNRDPRNRDPRDSRRDPPPRQERRPEPVIEVIDPVKVGLPARPVTDLALINDALDTARARGWNVLAPVTRFQYLPPDHQVAIRVIQFNAAFTEADTAAKGNGTYYLTEGKLSHGRAALDMLAATAGIGWDPAGCGRTDDGSEPFVWSWRMTALVKSMDGQIRPITRSKTIDLRAGSAETITVKSRGRDQDPDIYDWSPARLAKAREHGAAMAESKAANRAIRAALGLSISYSQAQAAAPFVFPCLVYVFPDTPQVQLLRAAVELGVVSQVFGPKAGRIYAADAPELHGGLAGGEVIDHQAAPAPRALPDNGPARDFRAEADRLASRHAVPRQELPPDLEDDRDPWDDRDQRRQEAPRQERRPDPRQERPQERRPDPRGELDADQCSDCGRGITAGIARFSADRFGRPLCRDHQPPAPPRR